MNGFFRKKYGLILFVGIFIAMGLTYWFGIRKMIGMMRVERDDIQQMLILRENREHQLSRLAEYDTQYEAILRDENRLDVFIARDNMIEFVRRLESLAEENNVTVVFEARDLAKSVKKIQTAADLVKTDQKESSEGDVQKTGKSKSGGKDLGIMDNLPSTTYTYLGLHVTGETKKVIEYLRKVETLPVALDIVSLEAIRKENVNFSEEAIQESISNQGSEDSVLSTEGSIPQTNANPFAMPETIDSEKKSAMNAFELEVTAGLVVYHPKE